MAILPPNRYPLQWMDGQAERTALYAARNITTGDQLDVWEQFSVVKRAIAMGTTVAAAGTLSVSGTLVTIPAGVSADAAYILVFGAAAAA